MHHIYFVKVKKDEAETARKAINRAIDILDAENFANSEGYWGGGKCDGFVVGGRWSGEFSGIYIKGDFEDQVLKLVTGKKRDWTKCDFLSDKDYEKYADEIQELWLALGGRNANPYSRNCFKLDGLDDDAAIITLELIAVLKKKHPKEEYFDCEDGEEKLSTLSSADIGDWLVVVDYHT